MDDLSIRDERITLALDELKVINTYLLGYAASYYGLKNIFNVTGIQNPYILDVGSGGGSFPKKFNRFTITSLDINPASCRYAFHSKGMKHIVCGDAFRLPFADDVFDAVHCSLFMHHFTEEQIKALLREFMRVSRIGIVINDPLRSYPSLWGITLLTKLFSHSDMVKHDAPLSIKRSLTKHEMRELLKSEGYANAAVTHFPFFRLVAVVKSESATTRFKPAFDSNIMNITPDTETDIVIIGGGPAGSSLAMQLAERGCSVTLLEKKKFPREILCGEFLSHEVTGMLKQIGLFDKFLQLCPNPIHEFRLADESRQFQSALQFTGYGLSRGAFDLLLLEEARERGVIVYEEHEVNSVEQEGNIYRVAGVNREGKFTIAARLVAAAFGKLNILDRTLGRHHSAGKSGYFGIKYHLPADAIYSAKKNEIAIYTANNVYCGLNFVEGNKATLAFLARRDENIHDRKSALQYLAQNNPAFNKLMQESGLLSTPEPAVYGTGNIYFGKKEYMKDGVLFTGDAAAVIPPLAGDGMGMAMENSLLLEPLITRFLQKEITPEELHSLYTKQFNQHFRRRLMTAGLIQKAFLQGTLRRIGLRLLSVFPSIYSWGMRNTRSKTYLSG